MFFFERPVFLLFFMATFSSTILTRTVNADGSPKKSDILHVILRLAPVPQPPINPDDVVAQAIAETAEAERRIAAEQEQTRADEECAEMLKEKLADEQKLTLDAEFALQEALALHMLSKSDKKSEPAEQKPQTPLPNDHHVTICGTGGFSVADNRADEEEGFLEDKSDTPPAGESRRHSDALPVATDESTESICGEEAPGTVPTTPLSAAALAELLRI
ncbi:hypothetical protein FJ366_04170, partial [Candidatus Dependentiae bacterium]|nr:hypothetical protein [Candidatus Dependentiae bacterium]